MIFSSFVACAVKSIGDCTDLYIVIPRMYENLPVVGIDDNAFENCSNIVSVIMFENIMSIGVHRKEGFFKKFYFP